MKHTCASAFLFAKCFSGARNVWLRLLLLFCTRVTRNEGGTSINLNDLMRWKDMASGASLRCRQKNAVSATLCVET